MLEDARFYIITIKFYWLGRKGGIDIRIVIRADGGPDPRRYNLPTAPEIAVLLPGSGYSDVVANRDKCACIRWWYQTYHRNQLCAIHYIKFCCFSKKWWLAYRYPSQQRSRQCHCTGILLPPPDDQERI